MITAVDTNILIDIFVADPEHFAASAAALREASARGVIEVCDVVWSECAAAFDDRNSFNGVMRTLGVRYSPVNAESATLAGIAWREYRRAGGKRIRVVADLLIGAHAAVQCDALLTRDRGLYGTYYRDLEVIDPSR